MQDSKERAIRESLIIENDYLVSSIQLTRSLVITAAAITAVYSDGRVPLMEVCFYLFGLRIHPRNPIYATTLVTKIALSNLCPSLILPLLPLPLCFYAPLYSTEQAARFFSPFDFTSIFIQACSYSHFFALLVSRVLVRFTFSTEVPATMFIYSFFSRSSIVTNTTNENRKLSRNY